MRCAFLNLVSLSIVAAGLYLAPSAKAQSAPPNALDLKMSPCKMGPQPYPCVLLAMMPTPKIDSWSPPACRPGGNGYPQVVSNQICTYVNSAPGNPIKITTTIKWGPSGPILLDKVCSNGIHSVHQEFASDGTPIGHHFWILCDGSPVYEVDLGSGGSVNGHVLYGWTILWEGEYSNGLPWGKFDFKPGGYMGSPGHPVQFSPSAISLTRGTGHWKMDVCPAPNYLISEGDLKNGLEEGHWTYQSCDRNSYSVGDYLGGLKTGEWRLISNNQLSQVITYKNGVPDGPFISISDGVRVEGEQIGGFVQPSQPIPDQGKYAGKWRYYDTGNRLLQENDLTGGSGHFISRSSTGTKISEGEITGGARNGEWDFYDKVENIYRKASYINGVPH